MLQKIKPIIFTFKFTPQNKLYAIVYNFICCRMWVGRRFKVRENKEKLLLSRFLELQEVEANNDF
jgi:hypothetical protein